MKLTIVFLSSIIFSVLADANPLTRMDYELFSAIARGGHATDLGAVKRALDKGANPNAIRSSETPLSEAIIFGKVEIVELLLSRGADPNLCPTGMTFCPMVGAIVVSTEGVTDEMREKMIRLMLAKKGNPNGDKENNHRPLEEAMKRNATGITRLLLQAGAKSDASLPSWDSPMLNAAKEKNNEVIIALLKNGEKPDSANDNGLTALWFATAHACAECVKTLLNAGARYKLLEAPSESYSTKWFNVIARSSSEVIRAYLVRGLKLETRGEQKESFLHESAGYGSADSIELLVEKGIPVDTIDADNSTPLHWASRMGNLMTVEKLIQKKANVHHRDQYGRTPKVLAAGSGKSEVVFLLKQNGANEYAGGKLPAKFQSPVLSGKVQTDHTGRIYQSLPILPNDLRFFHVHDDHSAENRIMFRMFGSGLEDVFVVFPSEEVLHLKKTDSVKRLGLSIQSPSDALMLARFVSQSGPVGFEDMPYLEIPKTSSCLNVSESKLTAVGVKPPLVTAKVVGGKRAFEAHRHLIHKDHRVNEELKLIYLSNEVIYEDGEYSISVEPIKVSGITFRQTCFGR